MWQIYIQTKWSHKCVEMNHQMDIPHLIRIKVYLVIIVYSWNKWFTDAILMSYWWKIEMDLASSYIWWNRLAIQLSQLHVANLDVTQIMRLSMSQPVQPPTPPLRQLLHPKEQFWECMGSSKIAMEDIPTNQSYTTHFWLTTSWCKIRIAKINSFLINKMNLKSPSLLLLIIDLLYLHLFIRPMTNCLTKLRYWTRIPFKAQKWNHQGLRTKTKLQSHHSRYHL